MIRPSGDAAVTSTPAPTDNLDPPPARAVDQQALTLRESGRSYAAIARELGFARSIDARSAFLRAVGQRPVGERPELLRHEVARLDVLERRIRDRDLHEPEVMQRHLATVARLRQGLD